MNQILKPQTSRSHYVSKSPAVTITVFKYRNKIGKIVVKTVPYSVNVNVQNTFTSHIDTKIFLTFFLTSLSLYIFTIWKCIAYNRFYRDGIYFDKILVSEYKLFKSSNKANLFHSPGPVACFSDEDDVSGNQNNCYWLLHSESLSRCKHHMQEKLVYCCTCLENLLF